MLFIALDQRIPKIRIHSRQVDTIIDKRIVVAIDSWPTDSRWPLGHYVKTLGVIGDRVRQHGSFGCGFLKHRASTTSDFSSLFLDLFNFFSGH